MLSLYGKILQDSEQVDAKFRTITERELLHYALTFQVPKSHNRSKNLNKYSFSVEYTPKTIFSGKQLIILDKNIADIQFLKEILPSKNVFTVEAREDKLKERNWIKRFIEENNLEKFKANEVVGIGGGVMMNATLYIAEFLGIDAALIPTTLISMADGSIGGKVRLNKIEKKKYTKHFYKSFYEPNKVLLDPRFLDTLSEYQITDGLSEIIKHRVYQSSSLLDYLFSKEFKLIDKFSMLKAILWAATLKKVCLDVDPDETLNGASMVLRGGHTRSDKIEEDSNFRISHGHAVAIGVYEDVSANKPDILPILQKIYERLRLFKSLKGIESSGDTI